MSAGRFGPSCLGATCRSSIGYLMGGGGGGAGGNEASGAKLKLELWKLAKWGPTCGGGPAAWKV